MDCKIFRKKVMSIHKNRIFIKFKSGSKVNGDDPCLKCCRVQNE